jgi:hypothetical protein
MHFRPTYSNDSDTEKALRFALAIDIQVDKGNLAPSWTAKKNAKQFETAKQQQMQQRTTHGEIKIEVS